MSGGRRPTRSVAGRDCESLMRLQAESHRNALRVQANSYRVTMAGLLTFTAGLVVRLFQLLGIK